MNRLQRATTEYGRSEAEDLMSKRRAETPKVIVEGFIDQDLIQHYWQVICKDDLKPNPRVIVPSEMNGSRNNFRDEINSKLNGKNGVVSEFKKHLHNIMVHGLVDMDYDFGGCIFTHDRFYDSSPMVTLPTYFLIDEENKYNSIIKSIVSKVYPKNRHNLSDLEISKIIKLSSAFTSIQLFKGSESVKLKNYYSSIDWSHLNFSKNKIEFSIDIMLELVGQTKKINDLRKFLEFNKKKLEEVGLNDHALARGIFIWNLFNNDNDEPKEIQLVEMEKFVNKTFPKDVLLYVKKNRQRIIFLDDLKEKIYSNLV